MFGPLRTLIKLVDRATHDNALAYHMGQSFADELTSMFVGTPPDTFEKSHELKVGIIHFEALRSGRKWFEYRVLDRIYEVGNVLVLKEYDENKCKFTDRVIYRRITYIEVWTGKFGIPEKHAVLSLAL